MIHVFFVRSDLPQLGVEGMFWPHSAHDLHSWVVHLGGPADLALDA